MNRNDIYVAKAIIKAQISSDGAKEIYWSGDTEAEQAGYYLKFIELERILKIMRNSKRSIFNYYVKREGDQNGYPSIIVYISYTWERKHHQISFHTPLNKVNKNSILYKSINTGTPQEWDKKCSRNTAKHLLDLVAREGK